MGTLRWRDVLGYVGLAGFLLNSLLALGALVLVIGLYPGPWLGWTAEATAYLHRLEK